jgi:hypothetical protein
LSNFRLRTKFLLSLLAISAGLDGRDASDRQLQRAVSACERTFARMLRSSVTTYQSFEAQREETP